MITSNASHTTMIRMAMPIRKAAGEVSMCEIVPVWLEIVSSWSAVQLGSDADFGFEQFRNRAACFGGFHCRIKLGLIGSGDCGDQIEMSLGDGNPFAIFFE